MLKKLQTISWYFNRWLSFQWSNRATEIESVFSRLTPSGACLGQFWGNQSSSGWLITSLADLSWCKSLVNMACWNVFKLNFFKNYITVHEMKLQQYPAIFTNSCEFFCVVLQIKEWTLFMPYSVGYTFCSM